MGWYVPLLVLGSWVHAQEPLDPYPWTQELLEGWQQLTALFHCPEAAES
jgi:hypothetical protein